MTNNEIAAIHTKAAAKIQEAILLLLPVRTALEKEGSSDDAAGVQRKIIGLERLMRQCSQVSTYLSYDPTK